MLGYIKKTKHDRIIEDISVKGLNTIKQKDYEIELLKSRIQELLECTADELIDYKIENYMVEPFVITE